MQKPLKTATRPAQNGDLFTRTEIEEIIMILTTTGMAAAQLRPLGHGPAARWDFSATVDKVSVSLLF